MYLDRAKERFQELNQLLKIPMSVHPCTVEQVRKLEENIKLKLPKAYQEFLLWMGNGGGFFASDSFSWEKVGNVNRDLAIELLNENNYLGSLPDDAIVFIFYHGGYRFAFIREGEGDNPPVHVFQEKVPVAELIWNYSTTIEEHCLKTIEWWINDLRYS